MSAIREFIDPFLNVIGEYLPHAFGGVIVLILGWILIEAITRGIGKILQMVKLDDRLKGQKEGTAPGVTGILTRVIRYVLLICLFLLVLDILGVPDALAPVRDMFTKFLGAFPHIVAGVLIGILGYIIAQVASSVVTVLLKGVDKLNTKIGLSESFSLSRLIGQLVFIFVFVPILIMALEALELESVSVPATAMLESLMLAIPKIVGAAIILAVSFFVGRFVANVVSDLLKNLGADSIPEKLGVGGAFNEKLTCSKLVGAVVLLFIMLGAAVSAGEVLEMDQLVSLLVEMTAFAGQIALGVVILAIGSALANIAHKALVSSGTSPLMATLTRIAVLGLVFAIALDRMGIADSIVQLAFGLTIGGVAVAFALAFGLGGRETAGKQLAAWFDKMRGSKDR